MSVESILEKIEQNGFRVHQVYQRGNWNPKPPHHKDPWYWDVVLVHTTSVWDYFMGQGSILEDALREAYKKGKVKVQSIEGLTGKARYDATSPKQQIKKQLALPAPEKSKSPSKKRVRLP
jgi:hypothetical protein